MPRGCPGRGELAEIDVPRPAAPQDGDDVGEHLAALLEARGERGDARAGPEALDADGGGAGKNGARDLRGEDAQRAIGARLDGLDRARQGGEDEAAEGAAALRPAFGDVGLEAVGVEAGGGGGGGEVDHAWALAHCMGYPGGWAPSCRLRGRSRARASPPSAAG